MKTSVKQSSPSLCLALCLLLFSYSAVAEPGRPDADSSAISQESQAMQEVREELTSQEMRWYGIMRVRWSYPLRAGAGFGAMIARQGKGADCSMTCVLYGWHFEVEPAMYGVQGSVGWGKLVGEAGRTKRLMHTVHAGWAVRGVVVRSWRNTSLTPQDQYLAGIEGSLSFVRLNFTLGLLRSLASNPEDGWVLTGGVGLGF